MLHFSPTLFSFFFIHLELWSVSATPSALVKYTVDSSTVNNIQHIGGRYTVNATIAGTPVKLLLDTGSTDMYVQPNAGVPSGTINNTNVITNLTYGDGTNILNGTIGLGLLEIAGFTIPQQAFLNVNRTKEDDNHGLVGLGFDGPTDRIPSVLGDAGMDGAVVGKPVLSSIFDQNPTKSRFFSLSLSRQLDPADNADASLVISGYDENYSAVQSAPILPQFPFNNRAWTIVTEGLSVGGSAIPWTSFNTSNPEGQTAVLLDTGTTNFLFAAEVRDAIYSAVPGAVLAKNSSIHGTQWSGDQDVWIVPCNTPVNMTTKFGGQEFPIHPLDITDMAFRVGPDKKNYTVCIGSITNGAGIVGGGWDALYGDSFLRNVYSVFSFGNDTTPPYVQFLADTVTDQAASDFTTVRANLLQNAPPELAPQDMINLFDGSSSGSSSVAASSDAVSEKVSENLAGDSAGSPSTDSTVTKYGPIVIGLLAAILAILLVVAVLGIIGFIRNGRSTGPTHQRVRFNEDASLTRGHVPYSD
ncbi:aspartic peptidase domain-containing protein [Mycena polygramma]|nr:aspartic peptidase domain-containing protein [Mycena polygramma]